MFTNDIWVRSNHISDTEAEQLKIQKADLNDIFENCEIIILSGGHTDATTHLIDREQFNLMQNRALFVNIARGKMVDEKAMAEAVASKNIYLALDVFEEHVVKVYNNGDFWAWADSGKGRDIHLHLKGISVYNVYAEEPPIEKFVRSIIKLCGETMHLSSVERWNAAITGVHHGELKTEDFSFRECVKLQANGFIGCETCRLEKGGEYCLGSRIFRTGENRLGYEVPIGDHIKDAHQKKPSMDDFLF